MFKRAIFSGCLLLGLVVATPDAAYAVVIQDVVSPNGIHAWLVQDNKLPIVAMDFAFRGGVEQDPADKQGLADLATSLMTEGAGGLNAQSFQQQLSDHSITMGFAAGRDALSGHIKMLQAEADVGFDLLHMALTQPRIDANDFNTRRDQQLTAIRAQYGNPGWQARYALYQKIYAGHPYGQRHLGSAQTVSAISRDDVRHFLTDHMARDNLVIAVTGAISAGELRRILDQVFADLPAHAKTTPIADVTVHLNCSASPTVIAVPREGTQTSLLFAMQGPKRDDPDWYAAQIANYILGGGGFSSRLMQQVRDKRGLTYGISTSVMAMDHAGVIIGNTDIDNTKVGTAWETISKTLQDFYDDGVKVKEINAAKDYLTGSMPLAMTSTDRIAAVLLSLQLDHLGTDYLDHYSAMIRAVTPDDVERVIRRWFNPDHITLSMVGKPEGVTPTQTQPLVHE